MIDEVCRGAVGRLCSGVGVTESDIQSDVRLVLLTGGLDLSDSNVVLESQTGDGTLRRIDVEVGFTIFEVKKHLGRVTAREEAQLAGYLAVREEQTNSSFAGVLTDGKTWRLFHLDHALGGLVFVAEHVLNGSDPDVAERLLEWLEAVMATRETVPPTPAQITVSLGASSAGFRFELGQISALYAQVAADSEIRLKRSLWAKSLESAFGTQFEDSDALFCEHTYLVVVGELVAHAAIGLDITGLGAVDVLDGRLFRDAGIRGVVEADFFDWIVADTSARQVGERIVKSLARRVMRFDWDTVSHDVLKSLYESVITSEVRHSMGEYYTPDWLAGLVVERVMDDPINQRVLDPSCGSGTFLYQTIRQKIVAMAGLEPGERFQRIVSSVIGTDLHPVAVTLARITYLLAIKDILQDRSTSGVTIPVFLGDSMQWTRREGDETLLGSSGLRISTAGAELVEREMVFPADTFSDADVFDRLVADLVQKATGRARRSPRVRLTPRFFSGYRISDEDTKATITDTYSVLCDLHDQHLNHIWGYYIRNLARPLWLSIPDNRVDVLVGNPPWLRYNAMPKTMQDVFKKRGDRMGVRAKGNLATHADLAALFVVTALDLYLRIGGRFGFVMPRSTLNGPHYKNFRDGAYPKNVGPYVTFEQSWDLGEIQPDLFPVPACVTFGKRTVGPAGALPETVTKWVGRINPETTPQDAATSLGQTTAVIMSTGTEPQSPYFDHFKAGANLFPRSLVFVVNNNPGPLGTPAGAQNVKSRRSGDKKPWKDLPDITGNIETEFIRPCYLGSSIAPFALLEPENAIIPHNPHTGKLLTAHSPELAQHPGLANWWNKADLRWNQHSTGKLTFEEQINYQQKLTNQFPVAPIRVVYTASGVYIAAAIITNPQAVIEHALYWTAVTTMEEAQYLTAVLNSTTLLNQIAPLQPQGQFGHRHFSKYPFYAPVPRWDPTKPLHTQLATLATQAETETATLNLTGGFQKKRKQIRNHLQTTGTITQINNAVTELLQTPPET